jgi:ketosteroid isomerase-like protein
MIEASFAAFNRGDFEALRTLYTEDCVWDMTRFPGAALGASDVYRGHDGLRGFLEEFRIFIEPWGGARTKFDQVLELEDGRLWLEGRSLLGSAESDSEYVDEWIQLIEVSEDGRFARVDMYWDAEEARRSAGLDQVPRP